MAGLIESAPEAEPVVAALPAFRAGWLAAVVRSARPRQWPKNLLVFAAPLAGASLGREFGFAYALAAFVCFVAASAAVYLVNDVVDAESDRAHPVKCYRPIAAGQLPARHAVLVAVVLVAAAEAVGAVIGEPRLCVVVTAYLATSFLYSLVFKRVPYLELTVVASGFVLRALGGAIATHVPPSGWFLTVCSLGALLVATAKRAGELRLLGEDKARHRPVLRMYTVGGLRTVGGLIAAAMIVAYILWALGEPAVRMRAWHLASVLPLVAALARFGRLSARPTGRAVEDLISRDPLMLCFEAAWLALFVAGL